MPVYLINQGNAAILDSSSLKKIEKSKEDVPITCFFNVIDTVAPPVELKNPELTTTKIREEINIRFQQYTVCGKILKQVAEETKKNLTIKINQRTIHDPKLKEGLIRNLKINIENNPQTFSHYNFNDAILENYVNLFIACYQQRGDLSLKSSVEWLALAGNLLKDYRQIIFEIASAKFLPSLGYQENILFEKKRKMIRNYNPDIQDKALEKYNFLQQQLAENYGFKPVENWNPEQPIEKFIEIIREKGYLVTFGFFNQSSYPATPTLRKIGNLEVYGWSKGTFIEDKSNLAHAIIVIGASKSWNSSQDLVYFIDPDVDANNANTDTMHFSYPVYVLSYQNFCKRLGTVDALNVTYLKQFGIDCSNFQYFYYHPQLAPSMQKISAANALVVTPFWKISCDKVTKTAIGIGISAAAIAFVYTSFMSK